METLGFTDKVELDSSAVSSMLSFAETTALRAGAATLPYFRSGTSVDNKLDQGFDPVTEADRLAERMIREAIEKQYPQHGIFGEEYGLKQGNGLTWVIDPIDGTRSFVAGLVHWGVLLGLFDGQDPVLGVMYQPYTDELFSGDGNASSLLRGDRRVALQTPDVSAVSDAVIATTGPQYFEGADLAGFERLKSAARMYRYGGDCYIYAMAALGGIQLAADGKLNAYDILPLIPIVRGAGGVVTRFDGGNPSLGGSVLASANEGLHRRALEILQAG